MCYMSVICNCLWVSVMKPNKKITSSVYAEDITRHTFFPEKDFCMIGNKSLVMKVPSASK